MNTVMELDAMRSAAGQACRLLRVFGNADRLMILCELTQGERGVGELEERLGITQPTLSQQLTVLRAEELVGTRREGKRIHYRLTDSKVLPLITALYEQFCQKPEA